MKVDIMNKKWNLNKKATKFRRIEWLIFMLLFFNSQNLFAGWGHNYAHEFIGFDHPSIDSACSAHYYAWGYGELSECIYKYDSSLTNNYLTPLDNKYLYRTSCIWTIKSNGSCTASQETTSARIYLTGCPADKVLA